MAKSTYQRKALVVLAVSWVGLALYGMHFPRLGCVAELVDADRVQVLRTNRSYLGDSNRRWLLRVDDSSVVEQLVQRARSHGENLAAGSHWVDDARDYCPESLADRFSGKSEYIGMWFLRDHRYALTLIDIVVSEDRQLVYLQVWRT
ncbi:MAG: hypothetical protein P1V35_14510 [Planctomycetota bacterium]|nr:hypothetical protein [Planctomycetota bacterium]